MEDPSGLLGGDFKAGADRIARDSGGSVLFGLRQNLLRVIWIRAAVPGLKSVANVALIHGNFVGQHFAADLDSGLRDDRVGKSPA